MSTEMEASSVANSNTTADSLKLESTPVTETSQSSIDGCNETKEDVAASGVAESDDDDDDELLALRIAALESIKLKKEKEEELKAAAEAKALLEKDESDNQKPRDDSQDDLTDKQLDYLIKKHPERGNLVTIITSKDEIEQSMDEPDPRLLSPTLLSRPPPGYTPLSSEEAGLHGSLCRQPPPPIPGYRDNSLSPSYRFSRLSPRYPCLGRCSRSPSCDSYRRSMSPRWSPSPPPPLSLRRRWASRSPSPPPPGRHYSPPPYRRYSPPGRGSRRSPQPPFRRRSPRSLGRSPPRYQQRKSPYKKSPQRASPGCVNEKEPLVLSETEWETDTDPPTDVESEDTGATAGTTAKQEDTKPATEESKTEKNKENEDQATGKEGESSENAKEDADHSQDDVLKLDATAEIDEFSKFLNDFEDELKDDDKGKKDAKKDEKKDEEPASSTNIPAEQSKDAARPKKETKIVDGKRLRKKVKVQKGNISADKKGRDEPLYHRHHHRHPRPSHYHDKRRRKSPFRRFARSPGGFRNRSPDMKNRRDYRQNRASRDSKSQEAIDKASGKGDKVPGKDAVDQGKEKNAKDYEERLAKLPSPGRQKLEARRRKFDGQLEVKPTEAKKISLKAALQPLDGEQPDNSELSTDQSLDSASHPAARAKISAGKYNSGTDKNRRRSEDFYDKPPDATEGKSESHFEEDAHGKQGVKRRLGHSPPPSRLVTDLRVQLHKKQKLKARDGSTNEAWNEQQKALPEHEEDDLVPVQSSLSRKVLPPGSRRAGERDLPRSDESASKRASEDSRENRRILVVKEIEPESPEIEQQSEKRVSAKKSGLKKSLHSRLGEKLDTPITMSSEQLPAGNVGFTEEEIMAEMMRQRRKLDKKLKKQEKVRRKMKKEKKKEKKAKILTSSAEQPKMTESDEELYKFFEENLSPERVNKTDDLSDFEKELEFSTERMQTSAKSKVKGKAKRSPSEVDTLYKMAGDGDNAGKKIQDRLGAEVVRKGATKEKKRAKGRTGPDTRDEELQEDILEKMRQKNAKRLRRMQEIEEDRKLYS